MWKTKYGEKNLSKTQDKILPPSKFFIGNKFINANSNDTTVNPIRLSEIRVELKNIKSNAINAQIKLNAGPVKAKIASFLYEQERGFVFIVAPNILKFNWIIFTDRIFAHNICPSSCIDDATNKRIILSKFPEAIITPSIKMLDGDTVIFIIILITPNL